MPRVLIADKLKSDALANKDMVLKMEHGQVATNLFTAVATVTPNKEAICVPSFRRLEYGDVRRHDGCVRSPPPFS